MISVVLLSGESEKLMYRFIFFDTFRTNFFFAGNLTRKLCRRLVDVNEWLRTGGEEKGPDVALALIEASTLLPIWFRYMRDVKNARYQDACSAIKDISKGTAAGKFLRISNLSSSSSSIDRLHRVITSHGRGGDRFLVHTGVRSAVTGCGICRRRDAWDSSSVRNTRICTAVPGDAGATKELSHWVRNKIFEKLSRRENLRIVFFPMTEV